MSVEAFKGARAVRRQYLKDRKALFAQGAIVEKPWTLAIPADPERNVPATTASGVCHKLLYGALNFHKNRSVQYKCMREGQKYCPMANRVPFFVGTKRQVELFNTKGTVVSHLCGEPLCLNHDHMTLEPFATNLRRLHCAGPIKGCTHKPPCLLPGRLYKDDSQSVLVNHDEQKHPSGDETASQESVEEEAVVYEVSDDESDELESTDGDITDNTTTAQVVADEMVDHALLEFKETKEAICPIQEANAELKRAQKMGNVA